MQMIAYEMVAETVYYRFKFNFLEVWILPLNWVFVFLNISHYIRPPEVRDPNV